MAAGVEAASTTCYTVAVKTSDKFGSGTDSNVYVQLQGAAGAGSALQLKESINHRNKFERGHTDAFFFADQMSLGDLSAVRVWHDNTGPGPGWHLECVDVHDALSNQSFFFPCGRWLARDEDDGAIDRMLRCTRKRVKQPKHMRQAPQQERRVGMWPGYGYPYRRPLYAYGYGGHPGFGGGAYGVHPGYGAYPVYGAPFAYYGGDRSWSWSWSC